MVNRYIRPQFWNPTANTHVAHILFRNLPNSNIVVKVERIIVSCPAFAIGFRDSAALSTPDSGTIGSSPVGSVPNGLNCDRHYNVFSKAEIYAGVTTWETQVPMGQIININDITTIDIPVGAILPPDRAMMIRASATGLSINSTWFWTEEAIEGENGEA